MQGIELVQESDAVLTARRELEICNACRYCEGFCAVFPAVELRREFSSGDLKYLANLCHNCRGCYYACQYAPPHQWGINVPRTLAELRAESYAEYAWPPALAKAFDRNGTLVSVAAAVGIAVVLLISMAISGGGFWTEQASFYSVIPLWALQIVGVVTFVFALFALFMGGRNFWRDAGTRQQVGPVALGMAFWDVATLKNLGGGGHGCNDNTEAFSMRRRWLHQSMMYGFVLCFLATCAGFILHTFLDRPAPYPFISAPVLLGTAGGILMLIGTIGLTAMKFVDDPLPNARRLLGGDVAMLLMLALIAASGLALLAVRATGAMGFALAIHLGFILAFFLAMPYSKMVHGVYRTLALVRRAAERKMKIQGAE